MSLLTDAEIVDCIQGAGFKTWTSAFFRLSRAIEAATAAKYAERIAELEEWKAKIIKESEEAYGESAIRYKFSLTKSGKCMNTFPKSIDGRWFALTPAENDGHIGHIARIAELQAKLDAAAVDAGRYRFLRAMHWTDNKLGVVLRPKDNTRLGCFIPSDTLLDDAIDHMQADAMRTGEPKV